MTWRSLRPVALAALPLCLVAQTPPADKAAAPGAKAPAAATAAPATPAPNALKPFAEIIKEAKEIPGLFPLWQKDDKVWLELSPAQLDQPYFFAVSTTQGIGERGIYGGMMGDTHVVQFKRIGNHLQLIAKNLDFTAKEGIHRPGIPLDTQLGTIP